MSQYDVVIIGGGMVGATLACILADTSLAIAVIDTQTVMNEIDTDDFDIRVSAITRASENIYKSARVWDTMQAIRVSPYQDMHVWDAAGKGVIHFDSADIAEPNLGHIIENRVMQYALQQRLQHINNVTVMAPRYCQQLTEHDGGIELKFANGETLQTRLLVGADGSRSWVRQQANIRVRGWDYDQAALVTCVKTEQPHQNTAWQRFMPTGPLAFLPLTDGYSSIVWSTTPAQATQLSNMDEQQFKQRLRSGFDNTLGDIETIGPRGVFPLRFFKTEHYIKPNLALVGDAAHTIHPLAGQGVNLGLSDAAALAQVIIDALDKGQAINDRAVLRRYERWREADNFAVMVAMDSFKRMYGSELPYIKTLRNTSMNILNKLPVVKSAIIKQVMGLSGDLSRFARK